MVALKELWPDASLDIQPHNTPGYDILVRTKDHAERYVEVKGTTHPLPRFFLSEGERKFAAAHRDSYTLLVIHSIDLHERTHRVFRWDGEICEDQFTLMPLQWACETKSDPRQ